MNALPQHLHADYHGWDAPVDDRAEAVAREGERIENDADKVRELVVDSLDATMSPVMDNGWTADLLIALRESKPLLGMLCDGFTMDEAVHALGGSYDHFRALLRCADTADTWIANLIGEAAEEAVDEAEGDDL